MREIKFRAWNKKSKIMIDLQSITPLALAIDPSIAKGGIGLYIPDHPDLVIEQYTGLKDKNGVEAYENDEIKFLTISGGIGKGVIEYEAPIYFVRMKTGARYEFSEFSDFEVIGSIHQEVKI